MEKVVRCPACGEVTGAASCPSCGADLAAAAAVRVGDRPASEFDQAASDQDQTLADRDQQASESDQQSADEDQHSADEDFAAGGDAAAYHRSTLAREQTSHDRDVVSGLREESAEARQQAAANRDRAATLRDRRADRRDALARLDDLRDDSQAGPADVRLRAVADRARAADDRAKAAEDRARAAADRDEATRERAEALQSRSQAADDLKHAATDELTGAWTRDFGLADVARELERAHRTGATLAVAFIDIDDLKQVNDSQGHLAGDTLLRLVGATVRANLRPYDVIVRYGGDEFVCVMPNLGAPQARARFKKIAAALTAVDPEHSIAFGLADAGPDDTLEDLVARADADLLEARRSDSSHA